MKKNIGAKIALYPTPVYLVATYDREGKPNIMTVGWGGVCNSLPPCVCISVRPATHTYYALTERKAFTVNIATEEFAYAAAFCGRTSGKNTDKFAELGLTPIRSAFVDAPCIDELPLTLECAVIQTHEIGSHTQFIGQIKNVQMDSAMASMSGVPVIERFHPIVYGFGNDFYYYGIGKAIAPQNKS